ncbi:hypothetical protein [Okeania sp.]|uniref:hypothetical protein n=1 Tax=Okeania sp. TaxID=3100323 RepID=UPI002B4B34B0|nr:hypothetical protein [Okeania sp.]MEB3341578.1 hypothetical protein [Okeania sp.]
MKKQNNNTIQVIIKEIDEVLNDSSNQSSPEILVETLKRARKILQEMLDYLAQDVDKTSNLNLFSADQSLTSENTIDLQIKQNPQQIEEFFATINQYLREDFKILKQKRQALEEEIRQLEQRRQESYSLAQQYSKQDQIISEFSQALLSPVKEALLEHLSKLTIQHSSFSQSINTETSRVLKISEHKQEKVSHIESSFIDGSNSEEEENDVEDNITDENLQIQRLSPQIDESQEPVNQFALPYPGYEFVKKQASESTITKTEKKFILADKLDHQESSLEPQFNIDQNQDLEILKSNQQEKEKSEGNEILSQLAPPTFEDNYTDNHNSQNQIFTTEDQVPITPELQLGTSENVENVESPEMLESLSNLFGDLEVDKGLTKQIVTNSKNQQSLTNSIEKLEPDRYIKYTKEPLTQSLLPEGPDRKLNELLLDTKTLEYLSSDLESLEEINVDESIDNSDTTELQIVEDQEQDLTENNYEFSDNSLVITSEPESTNLEDLFRDVDDISQKLTTSNQENISSSEENTENEMTLDDILDSLKNTTEEEEELTEIDNEEFLALENLIQNLSNSEKKN